MGLTEEVVSGAMPDGEAVGRKRVALAKPEELLYTPGRPPPDDSSPSGEECCHAFAGP